MSAQRAITSRARTVDTDDRLHGLDPDDVIARWDERDFAHLSDGELVDLAVHHLAVPRRDPADSFILHAPLELMARASLLGFVEPARREASAAAHRLVCGLELEVQLHALRPAGVA